MPCEGRKKTEEESSDLPFDGEVCGDGWATCGDLGSCGPKSEGYPICVDIVCSVCLILKSLDWSQRKSGWQDG